MGLLGLALGFLFAPAFNPVSPEQIALEKPARYMPGRAPASVSRESLAVQAQVDEHNKALVEEHHAFEKAGWHSVSVEPPNPALMSLDPALLGKSEPELQVQIGSNSFNGAQLEQLRVIATKTNVRKTRFIAIDAVGRSHDPAAAETLAQLYEDPSLRINDRKQILGYFHPTSVQDSSVDFLLSVIADPSTPEGLRKQAAFPIAMISGGADDGELAKRVPAAWQNEFARLRQVVRQGGLAQPAADEEVISE